MQPLTWQQQLKQAIRDPIELLDFVGLEPDAIGFTKNELEKFPVRVPHAFANRIKPNDPNDPILRQVFPYIEEEDRQHGYVNDPLAESTVQPVAGLLRKYHNRVLLVTTGACAVHCRYCFRRHFPYQYAASQGLHLQNGIDYIKQNTNIEEVILSGGDPLSLSDEKLIDLFEALSNITHVKRIRVHTRVPVVLPDRLSETLISRLGEFKKSIIFVIHCNHANELNDSVINVVRMLQKQGVMVLNQSVLLKGINDCASTLLDLSERLIENHITPYYLHVLDPVSGAAHYDVSVETAKKVVREMQKMSSGYLVPKLVIEEAGADSKTLLLNHC